jgi:hypothetical protein
MGVYWMCIFVALAILQRLRNLDRQTTVLQNRFRLYALRDELRELAIRGEVFPNNWVFQYFDSSIAKLIKVLDRVTIWTAIAVAHRHRNDERLARASFHLDQALAKPQNLPFTIIQDSYIDCLLVFFMERHPTTNVLSWNIFRTVEFGTRLSKKWRSITKSQTEVPETSTLEDFVPA